MNTTPSTVAVLLAAGLSTRMGTPKALLDWGGEPLVAYQVRQLRLAGVDTVIVVTGHEAEAVETALPAGSALTVRNEAYRDGRATSVRAGAYAVPDNVGAIVLLNVDQPRRAETIAGLLVQHRATGALISVPAYAGKRGHPAVLDGSLLGELRQVSETEEGLRAVMRRHAEQRVEVPFGDDEVLLDLNTPGAYGRAREHW